MTRTIRSTNGHFNIIVDTSGGIADLFTEPLIGSSRRAWTWTELYNLIHEINQAAREITKFNGAGPGAA